MMHLQTPQSNTLILSVLAPLFLGPVFLHIPPLLNSLFSDVDLSVLFGPPPTDIFVEQHGIT